MRKSIHYLFLLFICSSKCLAADPDTLIHQGSIWKFYDRGIYPGSNWIDMSFNDSSWASGLAEFGYGDGDENTVVSYGPNSNSKYITTYFRTTFNCLNSSLYRGLRLELKRDDGAVVYLNGNEIYRSNMQSGAVNDSTLALGPISGGAERLFVLTGVAPNLLLNGLNLLAVEIHQNSVTSSDISFDLALLADTDSEVERGPYLQSPTPSSMDIRWKTVVNETTKVLYGLTPYYTDSSEIQSNQKEHAIKLSNLIPNTKYYYAICSSTEILKGDSSNYFFTPPAQGISGAVRIWTMGDMGTGEAQQNLVRDAYLQYTDSKYTNLILWLGDDAYPSGTEEEYNSNVFTGHYENIFGKTAVFSAIGNHDLYSSNSINQSGPYFDIFNFPENGECGGLPSSTEAYYSFNYSNIHFVCLESNIDSFGTVSTTAMLNWLESDLQANTSHWTIVYFHCPPYSRGYHDSDIYPDMIYMRQYVNPILENHKVDLVLSGHDHDYERTSLIKGHFGMSSTFNVTMQIDSGSGTPPNYYRKIPPYYYGTVYAVIGSGGGLEPVQSNWPHPAMYSALDTTCGSLVIDVIGDTLDANFISSYGTVSDQFAIIKNSAIGIDDLPSISDDLILSPNPTHDILFVNCTTKVMGSISIRVINSLGQMVKNIHRDQDLSSEIALSVEELPKGIYFLVLTNNNGEILKSWFIKQ